MSEHATKQDVQDVVGEAVNKAVEDLSEVIAQFASQIDTRFNKVEADIFTIKTTLEDIKEEQLKTRIALNKLTETVDALIMRIDRYETEMSARDSQFEKLLSWAKKVSEKTGIPLEDL